MTDYSKCTDKQLMQVLSIEEDRLSRLAVDEMIRRGERLIPLLSEIVSNQFFWTREPPEWWAVVHATNILGAIGTESAVLPLMRAMRWADAFDCDWLTDNLPAMLGRIGSVAIEPLKYVAGDKTSGCFCRGMAFDGLALIAWRQPERQEEICGFIYSIFMDEQNDLESRQFAGDVLLDLKCIAYKDDLVSFARKEEEFKSRDRLYSAHFMVKDVEKTFNDDARGMGRLDHDWLKFYDPLEIEERQLRWKEEEAEDRLADEDSRSSNDKVGRNEPCPCGSGKKYKRCCLGRIMN